MIVDTGNYDVIIERGALENAGRYIHNVTGSCRCLVSTDTNVSPLYLHALEKSLMSSGLDVAKAFVFDAGEESKNLEVLKKLLVHMADEGLTRSDIVIALGGGVTGDLTGFASSVYLRGIRFVQIPTTMLAAVDSSVGGKTAVDLGSYKNTVGAFHEPALVICDPDTLKTLSEEQMACGMAEAIKMGYICDSKLLDLMKSSCNRDEIIETVIERCVNDKAEIVSEDFRDNGIRQKLNLGHTVGHAVEALSDFSVLHGMAVASGMALITKAAANRGYCEPEIYDDMTDILKKYGLDPYLYLRYSPEEISGAAMHDKKKRGGMITIVIPTGYGNSRLLTIQATELIDFIRDGFDNGNDSE